MAGGLGSTPGAASLATRVQEERQKYHKMTKLIIGDGEDDPDHDKQLSNEISAPYEVPQYPIEQIETKLIR